MTSNTDPDGGGGGGGGGDRSPITDPDEIRNRIPKYIQSITDGGESNYAREIRIIRSMCDQDLTRRFDPDAVRRILRQMENAGELAVSEKDGKRYYRRVDLDR